jgi:hypothetical protein
MKRTRHTAEQIIRKLKTAEQLISQGKTFADERTNPGSQSSIRTSISKKVG